jgi:hypothetical protein
MVPVDKTSIFQDELASLISSESLQFIVVQTLAGHLLSAQPTENWYRISTNIFEKSAKHTLLIDNLLFNILQNLKRCCLYKVTENIGTSRNILDNAGKAVTLQKHFYYQLCSFSREYLAYGLVKL